MRAKTLLLISIAAIPLLSAAQSQIQVTFTGNSSHVAFVSNGRPSGLPAGATADNAPLASLDTGSAKPTDNVVVWDRDSNDAAIRTVKEVGDAWHVLPADYTLLGIVTVRLEHEGQRIAVAEVDLDDKAVSQRRLIDPTSKGEAAFFGLPPGQINVSVTYNSGGKSQTTKESFYEPLERSHADIVLEVSIPDEVETVGGAAPTSGSSTPAFAPAPGAAAAGAPAATGTAAPPTSKSPLATGIVLLLGFVVIGVGGYFLLKWLNSNPGELKKLGVQMPEPAAVPDGAQPMAPVAPPQPAPVQQILLGDAAPEPLGAMPAVSAVALTGHPRLVGDGGRVVDLPAGESFVGREDGLAVSLAGESTVSRRHAALQVDGPTVTVTDLGSTNGTFVNGARLQAATILRIGDLVQFGSVRFRFEG